MVKGKKIFLFCIISIIVFLTSFYIFNREIIDDNKGNNLININDLSEEFIDNYFEQSKEINEKNDKDNILIVTSKERIKNIYGASKVIEAPNHQYILQYNSDEEKNKALERFNKQDDSISVEENMIQTVVSADYNSWGIEEMGLDYAKTIADSKDLNEITVAIIDTGCDMELFNANYPGKIVETYNVLNPGSGMVDEIGHGTHIAGTIAEGTPSNVKILPIKVSSTREIYTTDIISAINYITYYEKADVINMSFGMYSYSEAEYQAIEAANQKNIISVAAAGNENVSSKHYPSAFDNTISIAAVDSDLTKASFSNYGSTITFTAPGDSVLSINGIMSGTSMASPHAASAVAVLKSFNDDLTLDNTVEILKNYAIDLGAAGWDHKYGYGLINFKGTEFCDGNNCDDYNIFKDSDTLSIVKITAPDPITPLINYGSITNLMNAKINLYYSENGYYVKSLWQLDDVEIIGYSPYSYNQQTVTIKYGDAITSLRVDNRNAKTDGWEYEVINENNIKITNILFYDNIPIKMHIPNEFDGYTVTQLDDELFMYNRITKVIELPSSLTTIGIHTFFDCELLEKMILPKNITTIGDGAFDGIPNLTLWVYSDSYAKTYAIDNSLIYKTLDPYLVQVNLDKTEYKVFEEVDTNSLSITLKYQDQEIRTETITNNYNITYANDNSSFRYGDTYFIITTYTEMGELIEKQVPVTISKADANVIFNSSGNVIRYDGDFHGINLTVTSPLNATIKYMDTNGQYILDEMPTYNEKGSYTIKYRIYIDENYTDIFGEETLAIKEYVISDYEGVYDANDHSIHVDMDLSKYDIKYSINNTNYDLSEIPVFKDVGEYTINYKITCSTCDDVFGSNKVKIYGVKSLDSTLVLKNNILVTANNSFSGISNKIIMFPTSNSYIHYDKNRELISSDETKTGDIIKITLNNSNYLEYYISVLGDVNGDGKINYLDYVNVYNHIYKTKHPESTKRVLINEYLLAADMFSDNKVNYLDYVKIYNKIKELKGGSN